jgi:hypothetical protein
VEWQFKGSYLTKDQLAMLDILAHNNWKRPVYFTVTSPPENFIGLDKYLYNEGFAYHLLPLKPDTTVNPLEATNTMTMYDNMMNKFRWGNMKTARYLDHESLVYFYPTASRMFAELTDNLIKEGKTDLAKNALKHYDEVLPNIIPSEEVIIRKYYLMPNAYQVGNITLGNKLANTLYDHITNQLDYDASLLEDHSASINTRNVQMFMSVLKGMVGITNDFHQTSLNAKFSAKLKSYETTFGALQAR